MTFVRLTIAACALFAVGLAAQTPLQLVPVASGLTSPVLVTTPPGDFDRIFVVEQSGRIRIVKNGVLLAAPFLDLSAVALNFGETGLLGLAFHPAYAANGRFFVFYNAQPWPRGYLRRFTVSASNPDVADPSSDVALLEVPLPYGNHNGGMLAFGPDGMLYLSLGDGGGTAATGDDPHNHAQRGDSLIGKMLRLDVDNPQPPLPYGIPPNNPFAGPGDPRDEIWAFGFRNPWRFSFDRLTGDLYIGDVGGREEEVDFEPAGSPGGRNYGWSCMSGVHCNNPAVCTCFSASLTGPVYSYDSWVTAGAIIGGYVYRGVAIPDLRGAYFFADYMRDKVWSLRHNGTAVTQLIDRTAELTPPPPFPPPTFSAFGEDAYGEIHVCDLAGTVYKIVPVNPVLAGVSSYGTGTPGCSGQHALTAVHSPVLGNPAFTLRCSAAPASSLGILAFASNPDVAGSDPLGLGFVAHLQLSSPLLLLETMFSESAGTGSFAFPIPPSPTLVGVTLHAQAIWIWSPAVCTPSPFGWSSSPGLTFTLQP